MRFPKWLVTGVVVVALVVVVVVLVWPSSQTVPVIGDSITVMSADEIDDEIDGRFDADVRAISGQRIDNMLPAVEEAVAEHDVVVVNLGTNDVLQAESHPDWQTGFLQMVQHLTRTDCAVMVNISTTVIGPGARPEVATAINAAIEQAANEHDNLHVLDWDAIVHGPGGDALILRDQVHPTDAGSLRLAREIRRSLEEHC